MKPVIFRVTIVLCSHENGSLLDVYKRCYIQQARSSFNDRFSCRQCQKISEDEVRYLPHIIMTVDIILYSSLHYNIIDSIEKFHAISEYDNDNSNLNEYWELGVLTLS